MRSRIHRSLRAVLCAVALFVLAAPAAAAQGVKPDVDMRAPYEVVKTSDGDGRTFVAFASEVMNRGPGVLKVVGRRQSSRTTTMRAEQILLNTGSVETGVPAATVPVGRMQFSPSADHNHWHFLRFEDYMLLSLPNLDFAAPTRKTGFCLLGLNTPFWCGHRRPDFLEIGGDSDYALTPNPRTRAMGMIAPGGRDQGANRRANDVYSPSVEGQDIEITGVPSGRYCLSFVANPQNRVVEASYANNGSSRVIDVGGAPGGERTLQLPEATSGTPTVFQDSATCGLTSPSDAPSEPVVADAPALRALTKAQASTLVPRALKGKFRVVRSVRRACVVSAANAALCRVSFRSSGAAYRGTVSLSQRLRAGEAQWFYKLDVTRTRGAPSRVKTATLLGGVLAARPVAARRLLRAPAGPLAPSRPGTAWPQRWLPRESERRIQAYKPIG